MAKKRNSRVRRATAGRRASAKTSMRVKKPIILAAVEPKGHSMHSSSGRALYWLMLLAMVVLNMLATLIVPVLQVGVNSSKVLIFVAGLGFFFGYVTNRLLGSIDNLEPRHHLLARIIVPAAAMANLFVISSATNNFVGYLGFGFKHNPALVTFAYGIAFLVPSVFAAGTLAASFWASGSRKAKP